MADKTIITTVAVHIRDLKNSTPIVYDGNYAVVSGKTVTIEIQAGQPVTLEADEADRILARFGGQEIPAPAPAVAAAPAKSAKGD